MENQRHKSDSNEEESRIDTLMFNSNNLISELNNIKDNLRISANKLYYLDEVNEKDRGDIIEPETVIQKLEDINNRLDKFRIELSFLTVHFKKNI